MFAGSRAQRGGPPTHVTQSEPELGRCSIQRSPTTASVKHCVICLENNIEGVGRQWIWLNCAHKFHTRCAQQWLARDNTCPVCQSVVTCFDAQRPVSNPVGVANVCTIDLLPLFSQLGTESCTYYWPSKSRSLPAFGMSLHTS